MGKANRQRRAAKVRKRKAAKASPRPPRSGPDPSRHGPRDRRSAADDPLFTPGDRFILAVAAEQSGDFARAAEFVAVLAGEPPARVGREVLARIENHVGALWEVGWEPPDLDRLVARRLGRTELRLVRWAIASQAQSYETLGKRAAPAWMAALERIEARRDWLPGTAYLDQLGGERPDALRTAVRLMALLMALPRLPQLVDPPSRWRAGRHVDAAVLPPLLLGKIRALLAKAESTTFGSEAEAFTAKAQELMARHRIDRALLQTGDSGSQPTPGGRRVEVDDPYADAKALLLDEIADANGCRAVWSKGLGFTTVFGFADELAAVEELFTSLLLQATTALQREGSKHDHHGRSRTTRFRRSFLVAFAARIGRRLRDTVAATITDTGRETSTALVPLLAERDAAVERATHAAFPEIDLVSPSATDGAGWYAGTLFGDVADIGGDEDRLAA